MCRNERCKVNNYQEINEKAWDNVNESMVDHTTAISHGEYLLAQSGELKVSLAGVKMVPREWFPDLKGLRVLALASGGGQQGPVFAAHGANVTVTDLSDSQLAAERMVAERYMKNGHIDNSYLFYAATPEKVEEELEEFEIQQLHHIAADGPIFIYREIVDQMSEQDFHTFMNMHMDICDKRSNLGYSEHGFIVARKQSCSASLQRRRRII